MARSINQNAYAGGLPNFRNLGILLRVGVIVNAFAFAAAVVKSSDVASLWQPVIQICAMVEPLLILSLIVLVRGKERQPATGSSRSTGRARRRSRSA